MSDPLAKMFPYRIDGSKVNWDNLHELVSQMEFDSKSSEGFVGTETECAFNASAFPSAEEVEKDILRRSKDIFLNQQLLHDILQRYEQIIRKRWLKKTKKQKTEMLLVAWPGMSSIHRPDIDAVLKGLRVEGPYAETIRASYLWPSVSLEDLCKPRTLLIFMNARGRHPSHVFSHSDLEQARIGVIQYIVPAPILFGYAHYFLGRTSPHTYGEIVSYKDKPEVLAHTADGLAMHTNHALLTLEIQQRILNFLIDCCKLILHDIPSKALTNPNTCIQPEPPALSSNDAHCSSLEVVATESPYRVPAALDLDRLRVLVSAKCHEAEDHIWALREDPSYFADVVKDALEHGVELLRDTAGKEHPIFKGSGLKYSNKILGEVVTGAYSDFVHWDMLRQKLNLCKELQAKFGKDIEVAKDLPQEYFKALVQTRGFLLIAARDFADIMHNHLAASPPWRRFWSLRFSKIHLALATAVYTSPIAQNKSRDRLAELFQLTHQEKVTFTLGLYSAMVELERFIQGSAEAKLLLSSLVKKDMLHVFIVSECLNQLHLYQPWAQKVENHIESRHEKIRNEYFQHLGDWKEILEKHCRGEFLALLGDPSDGKFFYPAHKRRTHETVEHMRKAEANLDTFWKEVDNHFVTRSVKTLQGELARLAELRTVQRTTPWIEPSKHHREPTEAKTGDPFLYTYSHDRQSEITGSFDRLAMKDRSKTKTRGPTTIHHSADLGGGGQTGDDQALTHGEGTIPVDKRTLKVIHTLFHSPFNPNQPGEIQWTDFLHAMTSIGFLAERLQGSAWQFTPTKLDVERSIQFHEPHPSPKIPFLWARRWGRRLNRAYGWSGGMFTLT